MSQKWTAFSSSTKYFSKSRVKAMKQEVSIVLVGTLTSFGMLFVAPWLVVFLVCAFAIAIALTGCAQWLKAKQVEGFEPLGGLDNNHIRFVDHHVGESVPIKIRPPSNDGGTAELGALEAV
jgi:hypothetical protein